MLAAPLVIDVRPGAIAGLGALLADRRIAVEGRVAVAVGPGQGTSIAAELNIGAAELFKVPDGSHDVAVDLDRVKRAPVALATAGIGDVVSNLSAIADWELSAADTGEPVDGLAVAMARSAAHAVLNQPGQAQSDEFLTVLAEALIMSGMSMVVAGSSRPA